MSRHETICIGQPSPHLRSAQERDTQKSAKEHFLSPITEAKLAGVNPSGARVQNVSARVHAVIEAHIAHDDQADQRLIAALILAAGTTYSSPVGGK
jgi:hypothetical protein